MEKLCKSKKNITNPYLSISVIAHLLVVGILLGGGIFSDKETLAADGDNSIKAMMIDLSTIAAPQQSLVEDSQLIDSVDEPSVIEHEKLVDIKPEEVKPDIVPDLIVDKDVIEKLPPVEKPQLVVAEKNVKKQQEQPVAVQKSSPLQVKQEVVTEKIADIAVAPTISSNTQFSATPNAINRKYPEYPRKALDMRIEGHVVVLFDISKQGYVENIRIVEAKPNSIFNRAVIQAMKQWQYQPIKALDLTVKIVFNRNRSINFN